jgi:murein DD-endopeptidase MepM/ murein hydrolase activator NlpD
MKIVLICILGILSFLLVYVVIVSDRPPKIIMPVVRAKRNSYDQNSFGAPRNGHRHAGVDIFARKGTPIVSATKGIVIFTGYLSLGGKALAILSPDLKLFYYAHLDTIIAKRLTFVSEGDTIGHVGNTGNAKFTPPHLHFSIRRLFPSKKYYDPVPLLNDLF